MSRVLSTIILVVGIVLIAFGINAMHSASETVVEGVTGKYTEGTMWYFIGGIIMVIAGLAGCCGKKKTPLTAPTHPHPCLALISKPGKRFCVLHMRTTYRFNSRYRSGTGFIIQSSMTATSEKIF